MQKEIVWQTKLNDALKLSRKEKKPVLIDFFNPN